MRVHLSVKQSRLHDGLISRCSIRVIGADQPWIPGDFCGGSSAMPNCATPLRKAALVGPSPSGREPLALVIALSPRQSAALTLVLLPAAGLTAGGDDGGTSRRAHNDSAVLDP